MDADWYRDINSFAVHTSRAHGIMVFYANYGPGLFAVLVLIAYLMARSQGPRAVAVTIWAAIGTVVAVGVNQPVVNLVQRARPYNTMGGVEVLVIHSHDFSFPSDHAVVAGAAAAAIWLVNRRVAIIATLAAALLAFARVYVGAHYPGDVAAGLALGATVTLAGWAILHRPGTALVARLAHTPLRPLMGYGQDTCKRRSRPGGAGSPGIGVAGACFQRLSGDPGGPNVRLVGASCWLSVALRAPVTYSSMGRRLTALVRSSAVGRV